MNAATKDESAALAEKPTGLALLRAAVPEHLISPLPKGTSSNLRVGELVMAVGSPFTEPKNSPD